MPIQFTINMEYIASMARQAFDKDSFLNCGAVLGDGDHFHLFWGESTYSPQRPEQPSLAVMDFFQNRIQWKTFSHYLQMDRRGFQSYLNTEKQSWNWQSSGKEVFKKMFQDTQQAIARGELEKLVPYTRDKSLKPKNSVFLESSLCESLQFTQGFLYGDWSESGGFLGLTPEILVKEEKGQLETMALAGTCEKAHFRKNPESFLNDPKESKEHQKVVDEISSRLDSFGDLEVGERKIQETPTLVHLKTPMMLKNFQGKLEDVVLELHPTPALGSFPQKAGKKYLEAWNEELPRGVFGAPFGFSKNTNEALFLVAIRNIIWTTEEVKIFCGCGVVEESHLEKEWQELKHKENSVKKIFGVL